MLFQIPIFQGMNEQDIQDMQNSNVLRRNTFPKGYVIFSLGDKVNEFGIVVSGSVHIESVDVWGNKSILGHIEAGQVFAETYAFHQEAMLVEAVAAQESEILFVDAVAIHTKQNMTTHWGHQLMDNMMKIAFQKNRELSHRIFCTSAKTVRGRLFTYLSMQAKKTGAASFAIPFNRQQLADYLNLDRSALSKELGKMKKERLLDFHKNHFTLYYDTEHPL